MYCSAILTIGCTFYAHAAEKRARQTDGAAPVTFQKYTIGAGLMVTLLCR